MVRLGSGGHSEAYPSEDEGASLCPVPPVLEPAWDTQGPGSGARAPRRVDRYFPMLPWHRPSPFGLSRWDGSFEGTPSGNCLLTLPAARCITDQAGERADCRAACVECIRGPTRIDTSSAHLPGLLTPGLGGSRWRRLSPTASSRAGQSAWRSSPRSR